MQIQLSVLHNDNIRISLTLITAVNFRRTIFKITINRKEIAGCRGRDYIQTNIQTVKSM